MLTTQTAEMTLWPHQQTTAVPILPTPVADLLRLLPDSSHSQLAGLSYYMEAARGLTVLSLPLLQLYVAEHLQNVSAVSQALSPFAHSRHTK